MKASPVPVACLKHLLHINPLINHRIKTRKQGKHAHVCNFACWELRSQSPGSQSKTLWLVFHEKTENAQFSVNLFSSFIRFSGSAHIACDVFKGFGVLPQQAHKGKMSDICPACNFSTADIPLRGYSAIWEKLQAGKTIKCIYICPACSFSSVLSL